jgi:ubiquinone/menaquinone biosynthesis C-methylase UbiE
MYQIRDLKAFYDEPYTPRNTRWRELGARDKVNHMRELLGPRMLDVRNCLDVGCGTGDVVALLARENPNVNFIGVEIGTPRQDVDPRFADLKNFKVLGYDGGRLPFDNASFDLVFASHVLEHVVEERAFLKELRRVARKFVLVEVPCEITARSSEAAIQKSFEIGHINFYTPESFAGTLETSGLQVLDLKGFDHSIEVLKFNTPHAEVKKFVRSALLRIYPRLAPKLFIYHYCAVCQPSKLLTIDRE